MSGATYAELGKARKMKYARDESRGVKAVIPEKLSDMERICKDAFGQKGKVELYKDGKVHIADQEKYKAIRDGDSLVAVDKDGNAHDVGGLLRRYSRDHTITFTGTTEARDAFVTKQIEGPPPAASKQAADPWWNKLKFEGQSEAKSQFQAKVGERPDPPIRKAAAAPRQSPKFEGTTEARDAFVTKQIEPAPAPNKAAAADPWWNKLKFEGQSEAKAQYTPKKGDAPEIPIPRVPVPQRERAKFQGTTEARDAFQPKQIEAAPAAVKATADPWWNKLKFEGQSEAKAQYTPKKSEQITPKIGASDGTGRRTGHGPSVFIYPSLGLVRASDASSTSSAQQ